MAHFLTVADVLTRYQLRDRRSARRIMDEAGSFKVAGRLLVSEADLETWEAQQKQQRIEKVPPPGDASTRWAHRASGTRGTDRVRPEPLPPEWWKNERA
jgi:hypothetical protein